jgi:hypothetical protein
MFVGSSFSRAGGHEQLIWNTVRFKPIFVKRDKEQTMNDLRPTKRFFKKLCPSVLFFKTEGSEFEWPGLMLWSIDLAVAAVTCGMEQLMLPAEWSCWARSWSWPWWPQLAQSKGCPPALVKISNGVSSVPKCENWEKCRAINPIAQLSLSITNGCQIKRNKKMNGFLTGKSKRKV